MAGAVPAAFLSAENTSLLLLVYAIVGWYAIRKDLALAAS